jgi:CRISPR/Cas system-associated protein endoribonuclease Cas2
MNDPHNTSDKLEKTTRLLLDDPKVSEANKKLILKFQEALFAEGLSPARVELYTRQLRHVARVLRRKPFDKASRDNVVRF